MCPHPTYCVIYHSEYDEFDDVYEEYWCCLCNCWLTPGAMSEIQARPDWNGGVTEYELFKRNMLVVKPRA